jgi:hypothetical protein
VARPNDKQWRLGHRRPWWQWNVITLCVALFALAWTREIMSFGGTTTLVSSVLVFAFWAVLPDLHEIATAVGLERISNYRAE